MAKAAVRLEEEENIIFHINYNYMWKKLNTVPYYVSGAGEIPKWIKEQWLLPSYANLSKCLSVNYVPSINLVNKIVQFYNANIHPEVDTYTFLHEKLEDGDNMRTAASISDVEPFCGLYRGYYYAGLANKREIYGAMLRIQKVYGEVVVQMITGLSTDEDFNSRALLDLFNGKEISKDKYAAFRDSLPIAKRRTALYKGSVNIESSYMAFTMQSDDRAGSLVVLNMPLSDPIDNRYFGSIGMMTLFSERDLQILKMGLVRADEKALKPISLQNEEILDMLSVNKLPNEHILVEYQGNFEWSEMILSAME